MPWYSAIGLFRHKFKNPNAITQYEERTVLVRAKSAKLAEKKILAEFAAYCKDLDIEFLKEYELDELTYAPRGGKVVEVSSLMRVSDLKPQRYIEKYWMDLRPVSCSRVGWKHWWRNNGGGFSKCINCGTVKKGELWKSRGA